MKPRYCYWTVVDGEYAEMAKAVIHSAREAGVFKDFHVWADRPIPGAICHDAGRFEKWGCIFKLNFLRDAVQKLNYEYFVWFDTDTYFVRNPGDILRILHGAPLHITLESDVCCAKNVRPDWRSRPVYCVQLYSFQIAHFLPNGDQGKCDNSSSCETYKELRLDK